MPALRHTSPTAVPSAACRKTKAICASVNLDAFMLCLPFPARSGPRNGEQVIRLCYLNIAPCNARHCGWEEGERLWTPVIQTYGGMDLWDIAATHPWLHAIKALGDEFFDAEWYDDARDAYGRLLAMDPGDHLGAADKLERIGPRLVHSA